MRTRALKTSLTISVMAVVMTLFFQNCAKPFSVDGVTDLSSLETDSSHLDEIGSQTTGTNGSSAPIVYVPPTETVVALGSNVRTPPDSETANVEARDGGSYVGFGGSSLNITGIHPVEARYSGDFALVLRRVEDASTPALDGDTDVSVIFSYRQANGIKEEKIPVRILHNTYEQRLVIKALPKDILCENGVALLSFSIERASDGTIVNANTAGIPSSVLRASPLVYQLGCPPPPDIETPGNLKATMVTANSVELKWSTVKNARSYFVVRGREVIKEIPKDQASKGYLDSELNAGTDYTYRVYAISDSTVSSAAILTVSTKKVGIKLVQFEINPKSVVTGQSASVYCELENASKIAVYQGARQLYSGSQKGVQITSGVISSGDADSKSFRCEGYQSASGQTPEFTKTIKVDVTSKDKQAPSAPTGIRIQQTSSSSFNLYWQASTDNVGVVKYKLYWQTELNFVAVAGSVGNTMEPVTGLPVNRRQNQEFWLSAVDDAGNESAKTYFKVSLPQ